jgi:putative RNA 2'-phosphotransferase
MDKPLLILDLDETLVYGAEVPLEPEAFSQAPITLTVGHSWTFSHSLIGAAQMADDVVRASKFLSLVLRHQPELIGLTLDSQGWAVVDELVRLANRTGRRLTRHLVERVVRENDKRRFALSPDGTKIRASQGHSVDVNLALPPSVPPDQLYHGTATRFVESIRALGLKAGNRRHVHLSLDVATATKVGNRHGKPVVLTVLATEMVAAGHEFYLSENGVWLTEAVPAQFLLFPNSAP